MATLIRLVLLFSAGSLCCAGILSAEEPSLQERLLKPDMNQSSPIGTKEFQGDAELALRKFDVGEEFVTKSAQTKTKETGSFLGLKIPWFQSKSVATTPFDTDVASDLEKTASEFVEESSMEKPYSAGDRQADGSGKSVPVRVASADGESQKQITEFRENLSKEMSPEEIRELLNKGPKE